MAMEQNITNDTNLVVVDKSKALTTNKGRKLKLPVGVEDLKKLIDDEYDFIDKTLFIENIIESGMVAILILRPRRWGKTLNMSILRRFFEINPERVEYEKHAASSLQLQITNQANAKSVKYEGNTYLFKNLKITKDEKDKQRIMNDYQGQYPVLFLSFKNIAGDATYDKILAMLKGLLADLFAKNTYLIEKNENMDSKMTNEYNRKKCQKILDKEVDESEIQDSLRFLTELLYKYYRKKVYVLIDEYDHVTNDILQKCIQSNYEAEDVKLMKNVTSLFTNMLSSVGKTNDFLEKIVLTGIFDTFKKEGLSGFNNLIVSTMNDKDFSKDFGFTEEEVKFLFREAEFSDMSQLEKIKNYYNGYLSYSTSPPTALYNPWSLIRHFHDAIKSNNTTTDLKSYWHDTGSWKEVLEPLLKIEACKGSSLPRKLMAIDNFNYNKNLTFDLKYTLQTHLFKYSLNHFADNEEVFSYLLLNAGYITFAKSFQKDIQQQSFRIPNIEAFEEFKGLYPTIKNIIEAPAIHCINIPTILNSKQHAKVYNALISNNAVIALETLQTIFINVNANTIICEDDILLNFNYFELNAFFGSEEIFNFLYKYCINSRGILQNIDVNKMLSTIDYINMMNHSDWLNSKYHYQGNVKQTSWRPNFHYFLFCDKGIIMEKLGAFFVMNVITMRLNSMSWVKWLMSTFFYPATLIGIDTSSGAKSAMNLLLIFYEFVPYKHALSTWEILALLFRKVMGIDDDGYSCKVYSHSYNTDITKPYSLDTLEQFAQYKLMHESAYITVNSACHSTDEKITSITKNFATNYNYYFDNTIKFYLCEYRQSPIENNIQGITAPDNTTLTNSLEQNNIIYDNNIIIVDNTTNKDYLYNILNLSNNYSMTASDYNTTLTLNHSLMQENITELEGNLITVNNNNDL